MNERLKQLTDEASLYAVSDNSSMLFDVWKKRYTEKFAQLIVQECLNNMENCDGDLDFAIWKTKKYFGVE